MKKESNSENKILNRLAVALMLLPSMNAFAQQPSFGAGVPEMKMPIDSQGRPVQQANGSQPPMNMQTQGYAGQSTSPNQLPMMPAPSDTPIALPPLTRPSYETLIENTFGLTPEQIKDLRKQADKRQRAASELPNKPPKPVNQFVTASIYPGSHSPVIRTYANYVSSIMISDNTGQPWPIENFSVGNKGFFDITRMDGPNGSLLTISPTVNYAQSNLILYLKGLPAPISISLVSAQNEVDFRVDVRVQAKGPNAQITLSGLPQGSNPELLPVLQGVSPEDSKQLKVSLEDSRAWLSKSGMMYIRTPYSLISPGWLGSERSSDGMNVYKLLPVSDFIIMRDGKMQQITVQGW